MSEDNLKNDAVNDSDFASIDDDTGWPIFMLTLLRLGRILLKDKDCVREVMDSKVCKLLVKHQNQIHNIYRSKELRELLNYYSPDFRGGGIKVDWTDITFDERPKAPKRYYLSFEKIYKPEVSTENANES